MAIDNYIDKITKDGESRMISPAADKVRVENEHYEGDNLDDVLDEIDEKVSQAGTGNYTKPSTGIPKSDMESAVQTSLGKADSAVQDIQINGGLILPKVHNNVDIFVPTKTSQLQNDSGFITSDQVPSGETDSAMSSTSERPVQNKVIKAYVDSLIAGLIDGAPAALDTLKELATALGNNSDAIAAIVNTLSSKANADDVVKGISVNGTAQTKDGNGNVNIEVQGGDQVSVTTNQDGTFTIHVGSTDYTINLNHTHPNMAKLQIVDEEPSSPALDTIYVLVDNAEDPGEIQSLWIAGIEFVGGGGGSADDGLPKMAKPKDESTVNLGENSGIGVSKSIVVQAKNLDYGGSTTGLTIQAVGTGLELSYGQTLSASSVTIPQADAMNGVEVTVAYTGSGALADGELRFKQGSSVLAVVVVVVEPPYFPEGFLANTAWERAGEQQDYPDSVQGYCTNPFTEAFHVSHDSGNNYDVVIKGGFVKNNGELTRGKIMFKEKLTDALTNSAYAKSSEPIRLKAVNGSTLYNYVSATFKTSEIADCYIYDNVAHKYLWAGKNVDTSVAPEIPNV